MPYFRAFQAPLVTVNHIYEINHLRDESSVFYFDFSVFSVRIELCIGYFFIPPASTIADSQEGAVISISLRKHIFAVYRLFCIQLIYFTILSDKKP